MKLIFYTFSLFLISSMLFAQIDTSKPPKHPHGGKQSYQDPEKSQEFAKAIGKLIADHGKLIKNFSSKWKSCGGDDFGMTSLHSVATNLLAAYEAHKKAGLQPDRCPTCEIMEDRFECISKNDGLKEIKEFVEAEYVLDFLTDRYQLSNRFFKREARKLIEPFKDIIKETERDKKN